jgi:hypothetical protein
MAAPKNNQYWKLANDWKKPKRYQPDEILDKAKEYAIWCERNPLHELKVFGTGIKMSVPKMRAMTIHGFCLFCNMASSTWYEYEKQEAYSEIITHIKDLFFAQKFEGAAAELLNANIIARELGLSEKTDITSKGERITGFNYLIPDETHD